MKPRKNNERIICTNNDNLNLKVQSESKGSFHNYVRLTNRIFDHPAPNTPPTEDFQNLYGTAYFTDNPSPLHVHAILERPLTEKIFRRIDIFTRNTFSSDPQNFVITSFGSSPEATHFYCPCSDSSFIHR